MRQRSTRFGVTGLLGLNVVFLVGAVGLIIFSLNKGFDLTDEAFYIQNAWYPQLNQGRFSEFGQYLNPFVSIIGKDVAMLRLSGLLILLSVSFVFAFQLLQFSREQLSEEPSTPELIVLVSGTVLAALGYYRFWLITPSYNWFALLGLALVVGGGILALRKRGNHTKKATSQMKVPIYLLGIAVFIAAGGILGFIGRPTTALAFGLVVGVWFIFVMHAKEWLPIGFAAVLMCGAFISLHVWLFEPSWVAFLNRLEVAQDLGASLEVGHTLLNALERAKKTILLIPELFFKPPMAVGFLAIFVWIGLATLLHHRMDRFQFLRGCAGRTDFLHAPLVWSNAILLGLSALVLMWIMRSSPERIEALPGPLGLEVNLFLGTLLILKPTFFRKSWLPRGAMNFSPSTKVAKPTLLLMVLCCTIALANSFGSTSDLISGSGTASILYAASAMIAVLELLPRQFSVRRLVLLTLVAGPTIYVLLSAYSYPYRLPNSVFEQRNEVTFFDSTTTLRVDMPTAQWINGMQRIALNGGWEPGTPLIDLTGGTPGAAVILGGTPPTTPWLVGGYSGSEAYVRKALSLADTNMLQSAWILVSPDGSRHISSDALETVDLKFPDHYSLVGTVKTGHRNEEQFLWRPKEHSR